MANSALPPQNGFVWEYGDNTYEEKNILEDSLPEGYEYKINKVAALLD